MRPQLTSTYLNTKNTQQNFDQFIKDENNTAKIDPKITNKENNNQINNIPERIKNTITTMRDKIQQVLLYRKLQKLIKKINNNSRVTPNDKNTLLDLLDKLN